MEYQSSQPVAVPGIGVPAASSPAAGGRTVISEAAVAKVTAIAARSVPGVHSLGSGASRALGAIRDAVGSSDHVGVRVEVGETQVAVDIDLIAVYGTPLHPLADQIRAAVYAAVQELVGLQVIEVNVEINDVYVPAPVKPAAPLEVRTAPGPPSDLGNRPERGLNP